MSELQALTALIEAGRAPLSEWPVRYPGRRAVGYVCSYVPVEMIHAAGLVPVRLRGSSAPLLRADAHLQSFTCALCRSTIDQVLDGDLAFLAGTVFAHTCDAMQALADLWRINAPSRHFVDVVMQPVNLGTPAARPYLVAELERFGNRLGALAGRPLDREALLASIALYDETRQLVQALQAARGQLNASQFFAVLDAIQVVPREEANHLLAELVASMYDAETHEEDNGPRLFLTGAVLDEPRLPELIDDLGARVSGDDLCSGSRHFYDHVGTSGDPIGALADYFLRRPPCPSKLQPGHEAGPYVLDLARKARADGVVFVVEKFCEPHAFEYALALPTLDQAGMPHLLLEMEQTPSLEALRTRLQAFIEML